MKRLFKTYEEVVFYLVVISLTVLGYLHFMFFNTEESPVIMYKYFWFISIGIFGLFIIKDLVIQRRIRNQGGVRIMPVNRKIFIIRIVLVVMFFLIAWVSIKSAFPYIIILTGVILNYVRPKPGIELIYDTGNGVICQGKFIEYHDIDTIKKDSDSGMIRFSIKGKDKEDKIVFTDLKKSEMLFNHLKTNA